MTRTSAPVRDDVAGPEKRDVIVKYMADARSAIHLDNEVASAVSGMVFEVRQGTRAKTQGDRTGHQQRRVPR